MTFDRSKIKKDIYRRTQEAYERKDGDINLKYFKPEANINFFYPGVTKDEPHLIDIIPYFAGANHPQIDRRHPVREGDVMYCMEIFIHTNIGPANQWFICPARNYGKPCPICEDIGMKEDEGQEWDDFKEIAPKRRNVYNIVCYNNEKEQRKGVQIWELSHKYGEQQIKIIAKNARSGGVVPYGDPDDGKSISFSIANDKYRTISGYTFCDRDYKVSDEILAKSQCLDSIIVISTYDEIRQAYVMGGREEQAPPEHDLRKAEEDVPEIAQPKKSEFKCPDQNGRFGYDTDMLDTCNTCEIYGDCVDKSEALSAERKERRTKRG